MGVVFDDGGVEEIAPNLWRVLVLRLGFLDWELCPEFDLAIHAGRAPWAPACACGATRCVWR